MKKVVQFLQSKTFIWIASVLLIVIISVVAIKKISAALKPDTDAAGGTGGTASKWKDDSFPLKLYSSGPRVEILQQIIKDKHDSGIEVDGKWGPQTETAFLKYFGYNSISESAYGSIMTKYGKNTEAGSSSNKDAPGVGVIYNPSTIRKGERIFAAATVEAVAVAKDSKGIAVIFPRMTKTFKIGDQIGDAQITVNDGAKVLTDNPAPKSGWGTSYYWMTPMNKVYVIRVK